MRKYILSILLVIIGLAIILISYLRQNNPTYAEAAFATQADKFGLLFEDFTLNVKENIFTIKKKYPVRFELKDSLIYRDYFLEILDNSKTLNSVGYFQDDHKFVVRKENASYVVAVDSSSKSEVVKWERLEKGKKISSWYESFEESIYNSSWYQDLMGQNEKLNWYLRKRVNVHDKSKQTELFYVGYSYTVNELKTTIVLAYSKDRLFQEFGFGTNKIKARLSFMNIDGKELHLTTNQTDQVEDSLGTAPIDSLQISIANHFSNFKNVDQGSFSFNIKIRYIGIRLSTFRAKAGYNIIYTLFPVMSYFLKAMTFLKTIALGSPWPLLLRACSYY